MNWSTRRIGLIAVTGVVGLALAACSAPGSNGAPAAGSPSAAISTTLPKDKITLNVTVQTQTFQTELFDEFHRQHPNVSFNIVQEEYNNLANELPRLLSAGTTPDLVRAPSLGNLVKDHLVKNLDPYAKAYGWSEYPAGVMDQMRQSADGTQTGTGSLWANAVGGYGLVGLFYNKDVAAQLGMTSAPKTISELDAVLAKAKSAGITPIVQPAGNFLNPFQSLAFNYEQTSTLNDWVYNKKGATFVTPAITDAAAEFQKWGKAGYFPADAATLTLNDIFSRMKSGKALFVFDGDFDGALYQAQMPGKLGFMTMPPKDAASTGVSAIAPLTFVIPAKAQHADVAAYFVNWANTNPQARKISVEKGGSYPGGPTSLPLPDVPSTSITSQTLPASVTVLEHNAVGAYLANATGGIFTTTFVPQLELLAAGSKTPSAFVQKVQSDYLSQLGR